MLNCTINIIRLNTGMKHKVMHVFLRKKEKLPCKFPTRAARPVFFACFFFVIFNVLQLFIQLDFYILDFSQLVDQQT